MNLIFGLREAKNDLVGIAILDRDGTSADTPSSKNEPLRSLRWKRREIENYLCMPSVLYRYAEQSGSASSGPLFSKAEAAHRRTAMESAVARLVPPVALSDHDDPWWNETKASEQFLDRVFEFYFKQLGLPLLIRTSGFQQLAQLVLASEIDPEVRSKLDAIVEVAALAKPVTDSDSE